MVDIPFPVTVTFTSDWMCGTGTGRFGATDRQLLRDRDGLPMVRGKALAAMLRDGAETVARGLDDGAKRGRWQAWVDYLFGSQPAVERGNATGPPRPSVLAPRGLRLPAAFRAHIGDDPSTTLLAEATIVLRAGVRINRDTGTAADDMLRVDERARAGLTVEGQWTITSGTPGKPVPWEAELLLRAAATMVTAIGGKRRRGAGKCAVRIGSGGRDRLVELLDLIDDAAWPPEHEAVRPERSPLGTRSPDELAPIAELRITALSPLTFNRGPLGNIVLTEQFVPGSTLLALVARAVRGSATDAITGGRLVVTDATVEIDGGRSLPTPLCLARPREDTDGPWRNLLLANEMAGKATTPDAFCVPGDADAVFAEPRIVEHGHGVIDDKHQRPTEDSGGLYINRALDTGTVLRAQIWATAEVDIDNTRIAGERSLGRSRKDDYGHVSVEVLPLAAGPAKVPHDGRLTVWLTSDLLLRGENGQPDPTATRLATTLGAALGVTLAPVSGAYKVRRRESWQTRWGLPRPSLVALRGGSVFRFRVTDGEIDTAAWLRVQSGGLGERTPEGFGRIVLNPPMLRQERVDSRDALPATNDRIADEPAGEVDVTKLLEHGWRAKLRRRVLTAAADDTKRATLLSKGVTAAQLGTLRALANRLPESTKLIQQWEQKLAPLLAADGRALWKLLDVAPPTTVASGLRNETLRTLLVEVARIEVRRQQSGSPTEGDEEVCS
jgi:CRISPR-associated protein Csx10